jgi:hypothetical protein
MHMRQFPLSNHPRLAAPSCLDLSTTADETRSAQRVNGFVSAVEKELKSKEEARDWVWRFLSWVS